MKLREHYDWVVLGESPAALLSACLGARIGLSVLVVPLGPTFRPGKTDSGLHLDPEPNYLLGLLRSGDSNGILAECLSKLGVSPADLRQVRGCDGIPQVITPDARVSFREDLDRLSEELVRELGSETAESMGLQGTLKSTELAVLSHWNRLPHRWLLGGRKTDRTSRVATPERLAERLRRIAGKRRESASPARRRQGADSWFDDESTVAWLVARSGNPALAPLLRGLWFGIHGYEEEDPKLADLAQSLVLARTAGTFFGGVSAYREFLSRIAARLGAHCPPSVACRRVFVEEGALRGIQLTSSGKVISARAGVLGCSIEHLFPVASSSAKDLDAARAGVPQPSSWRFTLALSVDGDGLPPGITRRMFWQEKAASPFEISVSDPTEYGDPRSDRRLVFLRSPVPFSRDSMKPGFLRETAARMFRQATEILPYLEDHVYGMLPDFRRDANETASVYGFDSLSSIPESLRAYSGDGIGMATGIRMLYSATGESFPRLGTLGPVLAAIRALAHAHPEAALEGAIPCAS